MHQSLESNALLSTLERDLILHYLRELYEIYLTTEVQALPVLKSTVASPSVQPIEKEPVQKTLEFKFESPEEPRQEASPIVEIPPIRIYGEGIKSITPEPIIEKPAVPYPQPSVLEAIATYPSPPIIGKLNTLPVSIQELFEIKKSTELSDKLNELPLRDINRAIGLNDRLEIINNLFGTQKSLFDQIISDLNTFKTFEEAQELLGLGPAIQYKWDHEDRREKAIEFIRLIRRRYL